MGKDDPYQMNKLVCDSTTAMSERDIKGARKKLGRPSILKDSFDLDLYLAQQVSGHKSEVVVGGISGIVARVQPAKLGTVVHIFIVFACVCRLVKNNL
mmetsp:Transcript_24789/g.34168  ORF Transcript_24789/g.34168 Transcript_24789/m.34168 type:complete len:98 (+) Transcript_24789:40-333(+)